MISVFNVTDYIVVYALKRYAVNNHWGILLFSLLFRSWARGRFHPFENDNCRMPTDRMRRIGAKNYALHRYLDAGG